MMDSSYFMGSSLSVKESSKIGSTNQFANIHNDVRVHSGVFSGFDSILEEHHDQTAFLGVTHDGEDDILVQFFPGEQDMEDI